MERTDEDGGDRKESHRGTKKDHSGYRNGQFIQCTGHTSPSAHSRKLCDKPICCGGGYSETPCCAIANKHGWESRNQNREKETISGVGGTTSQSHKRIWAVQILFNVRGAPVFEKKRCNHQNRNTQEIIIKHGYNQLKQDAGVGDYPNPKIEWL